MNRYKVIMKFLSDLRDNNHKEWFHANRERYEEVKKIYLNLAEELIEQIGLIDPSVRGLTAAQCTFRINRDMRFSKDKSPYKTNLGIHIVTGGKKTGRAGYYIHLQAPQKEDEIHSNLDALLSKNMLFAGTYITHPKVLLSVREEIFDNGKEMRRTIENASKFNISDMGASLKRTPKGFPIDSPYDDLLRMKHIGMVQNIGSDFFDDDATLVERIAEEYRPLVPLVNQLNRAIEYAYEEYI